ISFWPPPNTWASTSRRRSWWATASGICSRPSERARSGSGSSPAATAKTSCFAPAPTACTTIPPTCSNTSTRSASAARSDWLCGGGGEERGQIRDVRQLLDVANSLDDRGGAHRAQHRLDEQAELALELRIGHRVGGGAGRVRNVLLQHAAIAQPN